jgi:hypothetical protein
MMADTVSACDAGHRITDHVSAQAKSAAKPGAAAVQSTPTTASTMRSALRCATMRRLLDQPPLRRAGAVGYAPDPFLKRQKNRRKHFPSGLRQILISNCEDKDYYVTSYIAPRGFSHGKTKSQG